VPLQNLPALVQILQELIHSAELRHHLGKSGYHRFFERFSIEQVAIGIEAVYRKIFSSIP
jgi:glycosyltransferase involved in cell wall biosynthesis